MPPHGAEASSRRSFGSPARKVCPASGSQIRLECQFRSPGARQNRPSFHEKHATSLSQRDAASNTIKQLRFVPGLKRCNRVADCHGGKRGPGARCGSEVHSERLPFQTSPSSRLTGDRVIDGTFISAATVGPLADRILGRPKKITSGEMREFGARRVLIYCSDYSAATRSKLGHVDLLNINSAVLDGLESLRMF